MSSILCDEGGTPIIDSQGNVVLCSGTTRVLQTIYNIMVTFKGSEILFPDYGFDHEQLRKIGGTGSRAMILQSMIVEALDPSKIECIQTLDNVTVSIIGTTAYVDIKVNTEIVASVSVNVN